MDTLNDCLTELADVRRRISAMRKALARQEYAPKNFWLRRCREDELAEMVKERVKLEGRVAAMQWAEAEDRCLEAMAAAVDRAMVNAETSLGFHGLAAYRSTEEKAAENAAFICANPTAEICVADEAIGSVGLLVAGQTLWFAQDVWSRINGEGKRARDWHLLKYLAEVEGDLPVRGERGYCEGWQRVARVVAVWHTGDAALADTVAQSIGCSKVIRVDRETDPIAAALSAIQVSFENRPFADRL